jgi:RNA polymerase-interacting CarD/CdnL/TRCF family regulator
MTILQDGQISQASEIVRELKRNPRQSANKVSY